MSTRVAIGKAYFSSDLKNHPRHLQNRNGLRPCAHGWMKHLFFFMKQAILPECRLSSLMGNGNYNDLIFRLDKIDDRIRKPLHKKTMSAVQIGRKSVGMSGNLMKGFFDCKPECCADF